MIAAICAALILMLMVAVPRDSEAEGAWVLWMEHAWNEDRWFGSSGSNLTIENAAESKRECEVIREIAVGYRRLKASEKWGTSAVNVEEGDTVHVVRRANIKRDDWFRYLCVPDTVDPRGPKGGGR